MADGSPSKKSKLVYEYSGEFAAHDEVTFTFPREDNKQLFFSMCILSRCSPVFKAMFEDDFKEKMDKNVDVEDIQMDDFKQFLNVCDPMLVEHPTDQNVIQVVEIAEKYQHESMIKKCRSIMSDILARYPTKTDEAIDVLSVAEKYGYKELLQKAEGCLVNSAFEFLLNTEHFEKLPLDLKYRVLSKRVLKFNMENVRNYT